MLGRMYFAGDNRYQKFLVFAPMLSSRTLESNKKYHMKKIKPFDLNLQQTMSNLADSRVILKFNNSVLVQKKFFFIV